MTQRGSRSTLKAMPPRNWARCSLSRRCREHRDLHSFPTRRSSDLIWRAFPRMCRALTLPDRFEFGRPDSKDRKSTRLNSSHSQNSYAVFCLKKKIGLLDFAALDALDDPAGVEVDAEGDAAAELGKVLFV